MINIISNIFVILACTREIFSYSSPLLLRQTSTSKTCDGDISVCQDCSSFMFCSSSFVANCADGEVCVNQETMSGRLAACVSEGSEETCSCPDGDTALIPDPYDSQAYFMCLSNGDKYPNRCEDGLSFQDNFAEPCALTTTTTTTTITSTTTTPETTTLFTSTFCDDQPVGFYDDGASCDKFLICMGSGEPLVENCPTGYLFSQKVNNCVPEEDLTVTLPFTCPPDLVGAIADPLDCTQFYNCFEGIMVGNVVQCEASTFFDEATEQCDADQCNTERCIQSVDGTTTTPEITTTTPDTTTTTTEGTSTSTSTSTSTTEGTSTSTSTTEGTSTSTSTTEGTSTSTSTTEGTSTSTSTSTSTTEGTSTSTSTTEGTSTSTSTSTSTTEGTSSSTSTSTSTTEGTSSSSSTSTSTSTTPDPTTTTTTTTTSTETSTTTPETTTTVTSTTTSAAPTTPTCTETSFYPYPGSCQKYYRCLGNENGGFDLIVQTCSGSLNYNPESTMCERPSTYPCTE